MQSVRATIERLSRAQRAFILAGVTFIPAIILRTAGLTTATPGFRVEEATQGLFTRQISEGSYPIVFGGDVEAGEPLFPYLLKGTGFVFGEGILESRMVAAMLGSLVVVSCALWLYRAMGSWWWGFAGGALTACSFWQLMYSRQALPAIAVALAASAGLWCLWEAAHTGALRGRRYSTWFIGAGVAFGLGIYAHVGGLVLPIIALVSLLPVGWTLQRRSREFEGGGLGIVAAAMMVTMAPLASFYIDNPSVLQQDLDLAGGLPQQLSEGRADLVRLASAIFWNGPGDAAINVPGRALIDPLIAFWSVVGLLAALIRITQALNAAMLVWLLVPIVPIALLDPNDPALLMALTPALIALPLMGMRAAVDLARQINERATVPVVAAAILSIAVSAGWSLNDYFLEWADDTETVVAMRGDLTAALSAADELPADDNPLYIMAGSDERIVRFLSLERTYRIVDTSAVVPVPRRDDAYLIAPASTGPHTLLTELLGDPIEQAGDIVEGTGYRIWFLDVRTRERLPRSLPAITFANQWRLDGYIERVARIEDRDRLALQVATAWLVPLDADPHSIEVRLDPVTGGSAESARTLAKPWKNNPTGESEYLLAAVDVPFPVSDDPGADLQVTLRDLADAPVPPIAPQIVIDEDIYALLNRLSLTSDE